MTDVSLFIYRNGFTC